MVMDNGYKKHLPWINLLNSLPIATEIFPSLGVFNHYTILTFEDSVHDWRIIKRYQNLVLYVKSQLQEA